MSEHTPGQIELHNEQPERQAIEIHPVGDELGTTVIADVLWETVSKDEAIANAERLVLAWNCHDDLLAAGKALLHHFCGSGPRTMSDGEVMGKAQAAIAKTEGKE